MMLKKALGSLPKTAEGLIEMNFKELSKFIDNIGREYNVPCYDICIYYNHVNVFSRKRGFSDFRHRIKAAGRNLYFIHSGAKIMCCVGLMRLIQSYKASLNDRICEYLPDLDTDIKIRDMITGYSAALYTEEEPFGFDNMRRLIEAISGEVFEEFMDREIIKPLKMRSTSFRLTDKGKKRMALQYRFDGGGLVEYETDAKTIAEQNNGCIITSVDDYARFCEAICSGGTAANGYRLLNRESVDILINELVYKETEKDGAFVCIGYHGGLVLIDVKKKITIVYAQYVKNMPVEQLEMYPKLRKLAYECIGADTWSMGYNMFP